MKIEMINKKAIMGIILTVALAMSGCSAGIQEKSPHNKPSQSDKQKPQEEIDPIKEQVSKMTLDEKLGQMVVVGLEGYTVDENTKAMIEKHHVGGFIFFGRNVESTKQLLALVNSLKEINSKANSRNNLPLFVSVDEEGGKVSRVPREFKKLPTNKEIGKINSGDFSYQIGGILAEETKAFGFNMNFAPVLDVNSNPNNPVIGDRSFGDDVEVVSTLGIQTMKGIQAGGVIPVVKHFPGHGDTAVDSHIGLPVIENDMERLRSLELVPFKEAIYNQADAVMIAHILLNKIDPKYPASLSKPIITDLLRKQLNFDGVVITDDMTMGAIVENYTLGDAAVKSVNAGTDIVLVCHGYENGMTVIDAMKKAIQDGTITEERVNESAYRVLKLKRKYKLADNKVNSVDVEKINSRISKALEEHIIMD